MAQIRKAVPDQEIVEYGYRNMQQYDLVNQYNDIIASLWLDDESEWRWTKRLNDNGTVEVLYIEHLKHKSINEIIDEFMVKVIDWLNDEAKYLEELSMEIEDNTELNIS